MSDDLDQAEADGQPPMLERRDVSEENSHKRAIFGVNVDVTIAVGRARPTVGELLKMRRDSLIPLEARVEDPVEVLVGKRVVARGELKEIEGGRIGVRLTEIVDMPDAL